MWKQALGRTSGYWNRVNSSIVLYPDEVEILQVKQYSERLVERKRKREKITEKFRGRRKLRVIFILRYQLQMTFEKYTV